MWDVRRGIRGRAGAVSTSTSSHLVRDASNTHLGLFTEVFFGWYSESRAASLSRIASCCCVSSWKNRRCIARHTCITFGVTTSSKVVSLSSTLFSHDVQWLGFMSCDRGVETLSKMCCFEGRDRVNNVIMAHIQAGAFTGSGSGQREPH